MVWCVVAGVRSKRCVASWPRKYDFMHINMAELDAMVKELNGLEGGESAATD